MRNQNLTVPDSPPPRSSQTAPTRTAILPSVYPSYLPSLLSPIATSPAPLVIMDGDAEASSFATGSEYFNSIFATALDRAGMKAEDLRSAAASSLTPPQLLSSSPGKGGPSSSSAGIDGSQHSSTLTPGSSAAAEGAPSVPDAAAAAGTISRSRAPGPDHIDIDANISNRLGSTSLGNGAISPPSDTEADDSEQFNGMHASTSSLPPRGATTTSKVSGPSSMSASASASSSAAQAPNHGRRSSSTHSSLVANGSRAALSRQAALDFAKIRGGGLGTPTGERTFMGASFGGGGSIPGTNAPPSGTMTPVMDKDGLGWPAKKTLDRLNYSAEQAAANQARLAGAVKTVLECLGEDPERDGLARTPERYAKALLWMTRGYEERLSGESRQLGTVCSHAW